MKESTFVLTIILAAVSAQQIIYFQKAKSLRRNPERGIFYANFKRHQHHCLDVSPITRTTLESRQECAQLCAHNTKCFSFKLASATDVQDRLACELLPTDIYNKSDKFNANPDCHHFSIKVNTYRALLGHKGNQYKIFVFSCTLGCKM